MIAQDLYDHMTHALHGQIADLSPLTLVNQAGRHLTTMYPWKWKVTRYAYLATRAKISITDGTWTAATNTLTSTGAFANYTWVEGDSINVTAGTGVTVTLNNRITSRTDDDSIVLNDAVAAGDLATGDITAATDYGLATCALPSDFQEEIATDATSSLIGSLNPTTFQEILRLRTNSISTTAQDFWGAIGRAHPLTAGRPVPLYFLWPAPSDNDADKFTMYYRAGWTDLTAETDTVPIDTYCDNLMIGLCRAFAQGYEEDDQGSLSARLAELRFGEEFKAARRADLQVQSTAGPIQGGHASAATMEGTPIWTNGITIGGPS